MFRRIFIITVFYYGIIFYQNIIHFIINVITISIKVGIYEISKTHQCYVIYALKEFKCVAFLISFFCFTKSITSKHTL